MTTWSCSACGAASNCCSTRTPARPCSCPGNVKMLGSVTLRLAAVRPR